MRSSASASSITPQELEAIDASSAMQNNQVQGCPVASHLASGFAVMGRRTRSR